LDILCFTVSPSAPIDLCGTESEDDDIEYRDSLLEYYETKRRAQKMEQPQRRQPISHARLKPDIKSRYSDSSGKGVKGDWQLHYLFLDAFFGLITLSHTQT